MKNLLTNIEMREADRYTIERLGVPSAVLMERAGGALADEAVALLPKGKILCVCGGGNNGGDGFVCARLLRAAQRECDVFCLAEKFSFDCLENKKKWLAIGGEILTEIGTEYGLIVDCLYGTGFHGVLSGQDLKTVRTINALHDNGVLVLSADIPSGVNGDNGLAVGECIRADVTLCIGEIKTGALFGDGIECCGKTKRVDIGISLPKTSYAQSMEDKDIFALLPKRSRNTNKGSYGRAAVVGGGMQYTGAAYLAGAACLRSGVGYTTLYTPSSCLPYYILKSPEMLLKSTNDGGMYEFNLLNMSDMLTLDSIAYGVGMGVSKDVFLGLEYLICGYAGKLIVDADGLNSLAKYGTNESVKHFQNKKCDVLFTPHVKECARLLKKDVSDILAAPMESALALSKKYGVCVLLKNAVSVLTDGERVVLNTTGNSGQAKGGSGDVLSGLIAGLCGEGLSTYRAAVVGAYLAGRAAELATAKLSEYATLPSDIIAHLGEAFLSLG